jgi:hypothetical protein
MYQSTDAIRNIESNTGKSARQGNLPTPEGKISIVRWRCSPSQQTIEILPESVGDFPVVHFLPVFDFISHFYQ